MTKELADEQTRQWPKRNLPLQVLKAGGIKPLIVLNKQIRQEFMSPALFLLMSKLTRGSLVLYLSPETSCSGQVQKLMGNWILNQ